MLFRSEKLYEHLREGRDSFANQAKTAVVTALRQAVTDFMELAAAAGGYRDDLLELDVEETLLTAIQLQQEADTLDRRTLADIRADFTVINQQRNRRPTKRFD